MGVALAVLCCPALADGVQGHARLVDGDTIEVAGVRVRLHGIDAPERSQRCRHRDGTRYRCGAAATAALARLIGGGAVICVGDEHDRYGRLLAICRAGAADLGREMVRIGMAVAYVKYSGDYLPEQTEASGAHRGIWAGSFERPSDFRADRTVATARPPAPDGCRIKGNISKNGRIYHRPGTPGYARTRIDMARGERWFCSTAEAIRAGWRAPRN